MKRTLCLLTAILITLTLAACGEAPLQQPDDLPRGNQIGDLAYTTPLTVIDQNGYTDRTLDPTATGKITVINFWAHWCPPCVGELPHFEQVAKEYADEVSIIAVHCDAVTEAQKFIGEGYVDSAILFAMDKAHDPFLYYSTLGGSGSIPYTVVLDADGIIRRTFVGAISYDTLVAAIQDCR